MKISRVIIKNFRSLQTVDVALSEMASCVIGENNTGKSSFVHALRLCLDVNLSSSFRNLSKEDVHSAVDTSEPFHVLVGVEFSGFEGHENEEAMLHGTQIAPDRARLFYRFRPKNRVVEEIEHGLRTSNSLSLEDYSWGLYGGGNPEVNLIDLEWNEDHADFGATAVGMQHLQSYLVVFLPALRNVEADLQVMHKSPLVRLIEASNIDQTEQDVLVGAIKAANDTIEASASVNEIAEAVDASFKSVTGPAFSLGVSLGLSPPTFLSIVKNLNVLLASGSVASFSPRQNGLGLNNILYISILIEYFKKRAAIGQAAGELLLVEEPESHLHPQLQFTLLEALRELPFQSIVTTHSTQITSKAPLSSFILLTNTGEAAPHVSTLSQNRALAVKDIQDLERYLDATKSNLLFARKVMLVEGASELILIPPLVKKVMGVDLEREGISVIAIQGVHFGAFSKLFTATCLPKRCAIVADADLPSADIDPEEDAPAGRDLSRLEGDYVRAFLGTTTFEKEITLEGNLDMLINTATDLPAPKLKQALEIASLVGGDVSDIDKNKVLRSAKRFGKARFAQTAVRHIQDASVLPPYISQAVAWLMEEV